MRLGPSKSQPLPGSYPRQVPERSALYRRYRPQTFAAIVGQEHVTRTFRNAIASGQVAHAYLLAGSRGIGKTTIARLIAKAVNCTKAKDGEPCDRCENCVAIVSRTRRFDLRRIPYKGVVQQLAAICDQEKLQAEPAALEAIARHAQGSLRDAESILDMVATFSDGKVRIADVDELLGISEWEETSALFDALAANDGATGVRLVGSLVDEGRDLRLFVRRAFDHMRALVLMQSTGKAPETASEGVAAKLKEQAPKFTLERLARIAKRLLETEQQLRVSEGTPLPLELAILDLVTAASTPAPSGQPSPTQPTRATSTTPSRPTTASSRPAMSAPTPMRTGPRAEASVATSDRSPATVVDLAARRA